MESATYSLIVNKENKTWSLSVGTSSILVAENKSILISKPEISKLFLDNGYGTLRDGSYCPCEYRVASESASNIFRDLIKDGFHP